MIIEGKPQRVEHQPHDCLRPEDIISDKVETILGSRQSMATFSSAFS